MKALKLHLHRLLFQYNFVFVLGLMTLSFQLHHPEWLEVRIKSLLSYAEWLYGEIERLRA